MKYYNLSSSRPFYSVAGNCRSSSGNALVRLPLNKEVVLYLRHRQRSMRLMWRISFQIIAMQMQDYKMAVSEEDKKLWKHRIEESVIRTNKKAKAFNPSSLPYDIPHPMGVSNAQNVTGSWLSQLTEELKCLSMNVYLADISRTNLATPSAPLVLSATGADVVSII